jgi:hypothetical protein
MASHNDEKRMITLNSATGYIVRVLVEDMGDVVTVCRPEEYEAARQAGRPPTTIGFKKTDIVAEVGGR